MEPVTEGSRSYVNSQTVHAVNVMKFLSSESNVSTGGVCLFNHSDPTWVIHAYTGQH